MRGHKRDKLYLLIPMKGKSRQEVIKGILRTYGGIDRVDAICLGVRFKVGPEVITQDVRSAGEALKREALEQERMAALTRERQSELALAREILKRGGT